MDNIGHWIGLGITIAGFLFALMQHKADLAKWRGVVETELKQAKEDRKIIHERIDEKESDTKTQLAEMQKCLKSLTTKVDILIDRQERKG